MKTVPLLELVERRTICVFRQDGHWMASWFSEAGRNPKELSWFLESPSMIHDALQMVFENEAEIAAFLAEPDRRFGPLRFLAYYGRQNASTLVMTVNELLNHADAEGLLTPMGTGDCRHQTKPANPFTLGSGWSPLPKGRGGCQEFVVV